MQDLLARDWKGRGAGTKLDDQVKQILGDL